MKKSRRIMPALLILAAASALANCGLRDAGAHSQISQPKNPVAEPTAESKGLDPRAAFESSGLIGGLIVSPESELVLVPPLGLPEAGASIALGGALSTAAIARRTTAPSPGGVFGHELVLASNARAELPGPALALVSSGERIVVSCADQGGQGGSTLDCFKSEGEGEKLIQTWRIEAPPFRRLLAVPGGRVALADEAAGLKVLDVSTGAILWARRLPAVAADIAYAPGLVLSGTLSSLEAFDESTGNPVWRAALTAKARTISAGNGLALVLADNGSLAAFSLADGKGIGAAPGPFDSALRPIADGAHAIVALVGGGAEEIDLASGQTLHGWAWTGRTSFIAADADRVYAGLDGREGRGILIAARTGEEGRKIARLESAAFDSPQVVSGARGGLLLLLMDGSLVLVGREREASPSSTALDAAVSPPAEVASAISSALGRFKPRESTEPWRYLRFDLFAQGMPVDPAVDFTAFRFENGAGAKRSFFARPPLGGELVAIYDDAGREIAASIDELGSSSSATAYLDKGRVYWIAAGWTFQATPGRFRLYLR